MQNLLIIGGNRLQGAIDIHGAKNSILPIISASILMNGKNVIHNCPDLSDVTAALKILGFLGIKYVRNGSDIAITSRKPTKFTIPDELMRSMRSSVMFLGSILARCGKATISTPGGCMLGPRPIDIHIKALKKLGASVKEEGGTLNFSADNGLVGTEIFLDFPSVGATENVIMAATLASGVTTLHNAALEPEIGDLISFLNGAGANIYDSGNGTVIIYGVNKLSSTEHTVIPDRIEAATYMAAAAVTGGNIKLNGIENRYMTAVNNAFIKMGCNIVCKDKTIAFDAPSRLKSIDFIKSEVYPGFPTDAGPLIISALCTAEGRSVFCEKIFQNRYVFVNELSRFGADISCDKTIAAIEGKGKLYGVHCNCTDLRGGAALIIAALKAEGKSRIGNICHIKRGYQDIAKNLRLLGADIKEV